MLLTLALINFLMQNSVIALYRENEKMCKKFEILIYILNIESL